MMLGRRAPEILWPFLGVFLLAGGLSFCALALARAGHTPVALWLANGAVIGWLVRKPPAQTWPLLLALLLGFLAAKQWFRDPIVPSLLLGLCNVAETVMVSEAIRRRFPQITAETRFQDLARVGLISALVACGLFALAAMSIQRMWSEVAYWVSFNTFFRAHFVGMMIAASASLMTVVQGCRYTDPRNVGGLLWDLVLLTAMTVAVFLEPHVPLAFLVYPPLLLLVFRHRFVGMVTGMVVIALVVTIVATFAVGPFNLVADVTPAFRVVMAQMFIGASCLVALPVALALSEQDRLQARIQDSELRYRMLADYSGDLVMRIRPDGTRQYVSPSIKELLGWEVDDFMKLRPDLIHPEDRERVDTAVGKLRSEGGSVMTTYRLQHKDGHYLWIEAFTRLVANADGTADIIYTGRDVTKRVQVEQALSESQTQLRTITDNIPAVIARLDMTEHYTYVNQFIERITGETPSQIIGKSLREVRGDFLYERLKHYLQRAYAGESVIFEYEATYRGKLLHFQAHYVPDYDAEGKVRGVYALTTEITHIKDVERELLRLAHQDSLTGLANRRYFSERVSGVLKHASQNATPVLLALVDIDHFKSINDTYGHAVGDAVLAEMGRCLQHVVREGEVAARIGGDEFVVLCHRIANDKAGEAFVHSLWERLHTTVTVGEISVSVKMSIGAAICQGELTPDALMKFADEALYMAKEAGRDTYRLVTRGLSASLPDKVDRAG